MEKQLKAWIYCRVLAPASRNLLNYQEEILSEVADDNSIRISGVIKEIGTGRNFHSFEMQHLITQIKRKEIDLILVSSKKRIAVFDDLYEEFEMLCRQHQVCIIAIDEIKEKCLATINHF